MLSRNDSVLVKLEADADHFHNLFIFFSGTHALDVAIH